MEIDWDEANRLYDESLFESDPDKYLGLTEDELEEMRAKRVDQYHNYLAWKRQRLARRKDIT
jgi:hypothetical protein